MRENRNAFAGLVALSLTVGAACLTQAGNKANPDAIELSPLPMPVEFKSDIDSPVPERFSEEDEEGLARIVRVLEEFLDTVYA